MLNLGLEHLDIDIGDANHAGVDAVVRTCGQSKVIFVTRVPFFSTCVLALAQLDSTARSPREKVAVLVFAHKLVGRQS